jgi:hypothetical protein
MTAKITRSVGISPGVPWAGALPGGGYDGKTKRLDRAVKRFAEWLAAQFELPVQIRFNSDRLSGGAFVVIDGQAELGLNARLIIPESVKRRRMKAITDHKALIDLQHEKCWTEQTPLSYNVLIDIPLLCVKTDLGEQAGTTNPKFGYWGVNTPAQARALLLKKLDPHVRPEK